MAHFGVCSIILYILSERTMVKLIMGTLHIRSMESAHIPIDVTLVCVLVTRVNSAQTAVWIWFISRIQVAHGHDLQKYHQNRPLWCRYGCRILLFQCTSIGNVQLAP